MEEPSGQREEVSGIFSTIAENIKSFFQREQDLSVKPKAVPEAASEVLERPKIAPGPVRIVDRPLPDAGPGLPFSPDELRAALKTAPREPSQTAQPSQPRRQEIDHDITHEIAAFENALYSAHQSVLPENLEGRRAKRHDDAEVDADARKDRSGAETRTGRFPSPSTMQDSPHDAQDGFFDEFEQFLTREGLEADGVLDQDILWRMKEFHKHRREGKEFYLYSKDVQNAIERKLSELKSLEREWFDTRGRFDDLEKELAMVEREIEDRTNDLKELVRQARSKSRLERAVAHGSEFVLADGRKLTNLLDMKMALRSMPESVFSHHVNAGQNDFATWVRSALGDSQLADDVAKAKDKEHLSLLLGRLGSGER